jgi:NodT family efflux transporter outer membrane factor (OMF) lipoprotein
MSVKYCCGRVFVTASPAIHPPVSLAAVALASTLGLAAALTGCAVGPHYRKPGAPPDAGFAPTPLPEVSVSAPILGGAIQSGPPVHGGEAQHLVTGGDVPFDWWQSFQSPALNALVERALKANPTVRAAQAALSQAQELVRAQRGFFSPSVGLGLQAERAKVAGNLTQGDSIGIEGDGHNLSEPPAPASPLYYTLYTAGLNVGYVPDVFGSNRRQVESLAAQRDAQRFALEAVYITLASNVVAAAIQEASLRAQIAATREIIAAEEKSAGILRDQFRLGFAMRIDVSEQEATLAQAEALLPPLQKQLEQTRDLIRILAGDLPTHEVAQTFELDALQLPAELPVSLPAKIIEQRPDVRAAEALLHAANAQVGVAVAAMLPQFSISATLGGTADQIPWLFRTGGSFWTVTGGVTQPLFEGGTLLHTKRAADAALKQAAAQYQTTVLTAYQNVADVLHASLSDAETLGGAVETEDAAKVAYDLTRRQMELGYVNTLILLNAETTYSQARIQRVQAQAARYSDTVALFQALGGGWWNRPAVAAR